MTIKEVQDEIIRLKKEKDICILAHSYQAREIIEIADYTGDSYALSKIAAKAPNKTVIMCGVRFMAETCKILSPEKTVILSSPTAGCPMAEQMDKEFILDLKKKHPGYTVVAYVNTTAALKTVCDVCVTSSSALEIVRKIESKDIIFVPDINLGTYVAENLPEKNVLLLQGGCPVHAAVAAEEAAEAKRLHPDAELLVHPECIPAVAKQADYIGSTSGIMDYAVKSGKKEFIIGTENSIAEHLQYMCPDKKFYPLSKGLICKDMKATTLVDVLECCKGTGGEEIILDEETIRDARRCIDAMISLGG
ncbi:MAG: quinolinate synthase NadA [Clostridia bacterium]|nr:quinolinate synthase NadA [Clostridia bacterium]